MASSGRGPLLAIGLVVLPIAAASAQPTSGLYLGSGAGLNLLSDLREDTTIGAVGGGAAGPGFPERRISSSASPDPGWAFLASLGYGFGNGLRLELEGSFRRNSFGDLARRGATIGGSASPSSASAARPRLPGDWQQAGAMANLLYDLPLGPGWVEPYVGFGLGAQWALGRAASADVAFGGGGDVAPDGLRSLGDAGQARFAYQAILGVAVPVPAAPRLRLLAEYRVAGAAGDQRGTRQVSACLAPVDVRCDRPDLAGQVGTMAAPSRWSDGLNHTLLVGLRLSLTP